MGGWNLSSYLACYILCCQVLTTVSAGNLNGAFPLPREDSFPLPASGAEGLPTWAWAIIAAATAVTVIWFIAIFLLVSVCGGGWGGVEGWGNGDAIDSETKVLCYILGCL